MLLEAAWALGLLAVLAVAATGWGLWGLRPFRLEMQPGERLLVAQALGWGLLTFPLLALGLLNLLYPAAFWAVIVLGLAGCWAARADLFSLPAGPSQTGQEREKKDRAQASTLVKPSRAATADRLIGLATAGLLLLTLPGAISPPAETDSLRAELAQAKVWLMHHGAAFVPNYHWNQPPLAESLYTLGLAVGPDSLPSLVHWWMGVLSAAAILVLGRRFVGRRAALLGGLFYAATPPLVYSAASAKQELFLSLYGWLALYALLRWNEDRRPGWAALAGGLAGLGAATKLMGLYVYPALGLLLLWLAWLPDKRLAAWPKHLGSALLFGAAALLPVLPWWIRNYAVTGDPLWPAGAGLFAGRYVTPAMIDFLERVKVAFGVGRSPLAFVLGPWYVTQNYALFSDPRTPTPSSFLLFLPGLALGWRERPAAERLALGAILFFCGGVFAFWWAQPQVPRYLYPLWGAASLACGAAAAKLIEWKGAARLAALAGLAFTVALSAAVSAAFDRQFVPLLLGRESREDYLNRSVSYYADFRQVSRLTPPGSRILVLEALSLYYLDRDYLMGLPPWEGFVDYDQVASGDELLPVLKGLGITHILWIEKTGHVSDLVEELRQAGRLKEIYRNPEGRRVTSRTIGAAEASEVILWQVQYDPEAAP